MKRVIRASVEDHKFSEKLEDRFSSILAGAVNDIVSEIYTYTPLEEEDDRAEAFVAIIESDDKVLDAEDALLDAIKHAYYRHMRWE